MPPKPTTSPKTPFAQWLAYCDLTYVEAAAALGISESTVANYVRGETRGGDGGVAARPSYAVRVLMTLIANGDKVKEWGD